MPLSSRKSRTASILLIAVLALFALTPLFFMSGEKSEAREAVITVDGEVVRRVSLEREEEFEIVTLYGKNQIAVKKGKIRVEDADCPAKICVKHGAISEVGEAIACLPHKLLIEIKETMDDIPAVKGTK